MKHPYCLQCGLLIVNPTTPERTYQMHAECGVTPPPVAEDRIVTALRACHATPEAFVRVNDRFDRDPVHQRMRERVFLYMQERFMMSTPEIAFETGGSTHTTVLASIKRLKAKLAAYMAAARGAESPESLP